MPQSLSVSTVPERFAVEATDESIVVSGEPALGPCAGSNIRLPLQFLEGYDKKFGIEKTAHLAYCGK
jgi:hypothetical protein